MPIKCSCCHEEFLNYPDEICFYDCNGDPIYDTEKYDIPKDALCTNCAEKKGLI
jgi:hypothetical protein